MSKCPVSIWASPRLETLQPLLAISSHQCLVPQSEKGFPIVHREHAVFNTVPAACSVIKHHWKEPGCIFFCALHSDYLYTNSRNIPEPSLDKIILSLSFSSRETLQTLQHRGGSLMDLLEELCHNQAIACSRYSAISWSLLVHDYFNSCFLSRNSQTWLHKKHIRKVLWSNFSTMLIVAAVAVNTVKSKN